MGQSLQESADECKVLLRLRSAERPGGGRERRQRGGLLLCGHRAVVHVQEFFLACGVEGRRGGFSGLIKTIRSNPIQFVFV